MGACEADSCHNRENVRAMHLPYFPYPRSVRTRCLLLLHPYIITLIIVISRLVKRLKINWTRRWWCLRLVGCFDPRVVPESNALRNNQ